MITPSPNFVSTDLGRLHVRRTGTGPPVVLWHSLFVDSRSWGPLIDMLARDRTVYTIDGPSHGKSEAVRRDFTFEECVGSRRIRLSIAWVLLNPSTGWATHGEATSAFISRQPRARACGR